MKSMLGETMIVRGVPVFTIPSCTTLHLSSTIIHIPIPQLCYYIIVIFQSWQQKLGCDNFPNVNLCAPTAPQLNGYCNEANNNNDIH